MKISTSQIHLSSQHQYQAEYNAELNVTIEKDGDSFSATQRWEMDVEDSATHNKQAELSSEVQEKSLSIISRLRKLNQRTSNLNTRANIASINARTNPSSPNPQRLSQATGAGQILGASSDQIPVITGDRKKDAKLYTFALLISKMTSKAVHVKTINQNQSQNQSQKGKKNSRQKFSPLQANQKSKGKNKRKHSSMQHLSALQTNLMNYIKLDSQSGAQLDAPAGAQGGAQSGVQPGAQSGVQSGIQLGLQSGVQLGLQSGVQLGLQSGVQTNDIDLRMLLGIQTTDTVNAQAEVQANIPSNVFRGSQSSTQVDGTVNSQRISLELADDNEGEIIDINYTEQKIETECLYVDGCGNVQLEDGREIDFDINLSFERYSAQQLNIDISNRQLKDPLIIDFGAEMAQFTDQRFEFDLDADGTMDWMPTLDQHGGLLVIDHDQDGVVDDGSEVVGAISSDAFADLQALDDDQNGWIDEQDEIYQNLRVWTWDEEGNQELMGLMQAGVGAIYLGAIEAEFSQVDDSSQVVAQQKALSVYLKNSGEVGSVRRVDVAL